MGTIFDLLGRGSVITIDIQDLREVDHPRVEYILGSSTDPEILTKVRQRIAELQPAHILGNSR